MKTFLFARMYRHPEVKRVREKADAIVRRLFQAYSDDPTAMPADWAAKAGEGESGRARAIGDYIAGMTDRFALGEYRRLFDPTADLR
jgi:dGTPase